ncbi:MAG: hypothetical protein RLZZ511_4145 [Cyanobacteriota bacterium]|jgi:hypothetical protein
MFRKSIALLIGVTAAFTAVQPASAIGARSVDTDCLWIGEDGEKVHQRCVISADVSAGSGLFFRLEWADGTKTVIHSAPNTSSFVTPESNRKVQALGRFDAGRMHFPRQIKIQGLGTVMLRYENFAKSNVYCQYDKSTLTQALDSTLNSMKVMRDMSVPRMHAYTAVAAHKYMCIRREHIFNEVLQSLKSRYPDQVQIVEDFSLKLERERPSED